MVRHALGVLGVLAAGVLLAVSAAMNYRFGFSLGKTEMDGQIYGLASAAADCFKALAPFFFFAAVRNKMWSQAMAAAVVWVVVTGYSMTSAVGHAALNRLDTTSQRAVEAASYKDLRADLKRAQEQLAWIPQHRPAATVEADIASQKTQRMWTWTNGCNAASTTAAAARTFCSGVHKLEAERASALEASKLEARIAEINGKLGNQHGTVMAEADPQASVLSKLIGVDIDKIQTGLALFVALLIEIGSGFGMYVAFSQWRLYDSHVPAAPRFARAAEEDTAAAAVAAPVHPVAVQVKKPRSGANDNRSIEKPTERPAIEARAEEAKVVETKVEAKVESKVEAKPAPSRLVAPETDVQRFYKESIEVQDGSSVTATQLYEDYCSWCDTRGKEPLALPSFGREFADLGVKKERIAGRVRYIGISLKSDTGHEEAMKTPTYQVDAA